MSPGPHVDTAARKLRESLKNPHFRRLKFPQVQKEDCRLEAALPFAKRFDESTAEWDDEIGYTIEELRDRLKKMQSSLLPMLHIGPEEINNILTFVESL